MARKSISEKRAERERKEDRTLRQVFNVFLLGLAAECYLLVVYRGYVSGSFESLFFWYDLLRYGAVAGLVLAAVGLVLLLLGWKKPGKAGGRLRLAGCWGAGVGVFLALSGWITTYFFNESTGVTLMCVLVPVLTVLALIYLLYQHECFLCTAALSGTLFAVWARGGSFISPVWRTPVLLGTVFAAVVLVAAAALTRGAQRTGGKLWGVRAFTPECDYRVVYGVLAFGFVCVLAVLALPAQAYYLMWAVGILIFAELVFYTTKLM